MQVHQLQIVVDALQDRLLLRISTTAQEEIRVFLTRRLLRELWPGLVGMLFGHLGSQAPAGGAKAVPPPAGNFEQPYRNDDLTFPLGSAPLMPAEVTIEPTGEGSCRMLFREHKERSFSFGLNGELMQALCSMLRAGSEQARWDLSLDYRQSPATPEAFPPAGNHFH